jgi:hypothetical protein
LAFQPLREKALAFKNAQNNLITIASDAIANFALANI